MARKFQPKAGATVVTLLALGVLVALGVWQLQRLEWKTALIAQIEKQAALAPVPLPEKIDNPQDWQYRNVTMAGSFMHDKSFLVKPRTQDGKNGYHLIVPFKRASGGVVFVNRGWVSDETLPKVKKKKGIVKVEGVALLPEKSAFPDNAPEKNDWYWADVKAMAENAKIENAYPLLVQVTRMKAGEVPSGASAVQAIKNDHRYYAFFWFCMAGILLAVWFIYHWQEKKDASV